MLENQAEIIEKPVKTVKTTRYFVVLFCSAIVIVLLGLVISLYYKNQLLSNKLSQTQKTSITEVNPTPTSSEKLEKYNHELDNQFDFNFSYPTGSKIEEKTSEDKKEFTVTVLPPAPYSTATTTFEIKVIKQVTGKTVNEYNPSLYVQRLKSKDNELLSGILPAKLGSVGLPTYEFYTHHCEEWGVDCKKQSVYYINPMGYFYTITTTHFTDSDGNPFRNNMLDKMVASIDFTERK